MFSFFKRDKRYPAFEALKKFDNKDSYFIRVAEWDWLNKEAIVVTDPYGPRLITMDPWPQLVFIAANGQMTVSEYVYYMANKYTSEIPENVDRTIIDEITKLMGYRIIVFVDEKQRPEKRFEMPRSYQP